MVEHLQLSHSLVLWTITILFKFIIVFNYVPNAFDLGITILIPKGHKNHVFNKLEDFRGITMTAVGLVLFYQRFLNFAILNV